MATATFPVTITALFALAVTGQAQTTDRVFHFAHTPTERAAQEIGTSIRTIADMKDASVNFGAGTLTVNGTDDQLKLAEWMFIGMDRSVPIPADSNVHEYLMPNGTDNVVRLFYIDSGQTVQEFQEFATMLRTIAEIRRVFTYNEGKILAMRGTADQMGMADYFTNQLAKSAPAPRPHSITTQYLLPADPSNFPHEVLGTITRIFFVANSATTQDFQELATLIRTIVEVRRVFTYNTPRAMAVRGTSDQLGFAQWLFNELDQPSHGGAAASYSYQAGSPETEVRAFYLPHTATMKDFQQLATTIRTATGTKMAFTLNTPRAMVLRGTLDQMQLAQKLLMDLDPADFPKAP